LYYEVYHLTRDTFGQTRYQVDYVLRGQDTGSVGARILGGLGKLLGQALSENGLKISYEHTGEEEQEPVYIELDVSSITQPQVDLTVTVTDLNSRTEVTKSIRFFVVDTVSVSGDQESE
ncbi:MAG: hypothetical protein QGG64_02570, partial [Candidatus Latescibacteria bacterium]|nr:hypothetical protein [Candidatus Latescibacterota bacterium]